MQGLNSDPPDQYGTMTEHSGSYGFRQTGTSDHGSPSGSDVDDPGNSVYPYPHKMDVELDDDSNLSLTSQSLNADGTPKRPMNAFMIFARRRRPQVSAENQSMRTGEISKILSREWSAMDPSEKQFYLDQAKKLKDTFNQKYPDYVYKRRPNNSRRRRKTDSGLSASEQYSTAELIEGYPSGYPDPLHVEVGNADEPSYSGHDALCPAGPSSSSYATSHPRGNTYQPSAAAGVAYSTSHHGQPPPAADGGLSMQPSTSAFCHPYLSSQMPPPYSFESGGSEGWSTSRNNAARLSLQSWSQSNQDHMQAGENRRRGYEQQLPSHGWVNAAPSDSGGTVGTDTPNYGFPTLNSPFFPGQSGSQGSFSPLLPASHAVSNPQYSTSQGQGTLQGRNDAAYDTRTYPPHPPMHSTYHQGTSAAMGNYHHARNVLPSAQPLADYSHALQPSVAGSGVDVPQQQHRYWSRESSDSQGNVP